MGYFIKRKNKSNRSDPDALVRKAEASLRQTESQQPHVDRITMWLRNRDNQNGFGEDFEYTLRPKRRHA